MCYVINKSTGETRKFKYAYCANCTGEMNGFFHFVMYRAGFANSIVNQNTHSSMNFKEEHP